MFLSSWRRLVERTLPSSRRDRSRTHSLRLHCESLEPRCQPSAFVFSTGIPDGKVATITEPASARTSQVEYESADDFALTTETVLQQASFTGLLTGGATPTDVRNVVVEIYRVFPNDSDVSRTSGPPTFSTNKVPTRVNSPSDIAFDSLDSADNELNFHSRVLSASFTALASVSSAAQISVNSKGNGPVTGEEVEFDVTFKAHFDLPAGHYFFVPQVGLSHKAPAGADFLWLSAPKPIVPPGTPFPAGFTDLQSWMRDDPPLAPDWLRIGTDIIGGTTFNASFSLKGQTRGGDLAPRAAAEGNPGLAPAIIGSTLSSFPDEPSTSIMVASTERGLLKAPPLFSNDNVAAVVTAAFSQTDNLFALSRKSASAHGQSIVETAPYHEGIAGAPLELSTSVQT
jgi:hypothetical protein